MRLKNYFLIACVSTFSIGAIAQEGESLESSVVPNAIPAEHLLPPTALSSDGGMYTFATAGAWSDFVYNPNITTAGQWIFGPLLNAPSGTPSTSIVQNITWQWNIFNYDSNLTTYICESTLNYCFDISGNFGAGGNVSSYNIPANRSWRYGFYYAGSGNISPPLLGQNGSIAVTYQ